MGFRYVPAKFNRTRSFEASIIDNKAGSPPLSRRRYFDVYADPIALRNCEHLCLLVKACWLKRKSWCRVATHTNNVYWNQQLRMGDKGGEM